MHLSWSLTYTICEVNRVRAQLQSTSILQCQSVFIGDYLCLCLGRVCVNPDIGRHSSENQPQVRAEADNITHLTDKIVLLHQIFFYYYNKIFCWSDWKLVPISIWWRRVICLCCSIQYQLLKKEYKIAWFLQVAQVASVCSLRRFKNTKMHF